MYENKEIHEEVNELVKKQMEGTLTFMKPSSQNYAMEWKLFNDFSNEIIKLNE